MTCCTPAMRTRIGGQSLTGFRIELHELDSAPVGTECKPQGSVVVGKYRGIDCVQIAALPRLHDYASWDRLDREWGGREPDCRSNFSEAGDGVVQQLSIAEVDDVGSPIVHVPVLGNGCGNPLGSGPEDRRAGFPLHQSFGMKRRNATSGREDPELALAFHVVDGSRIVIPRLAVCSSGSPARDAGSVSSARAIAGRDPASRSVETTQYEENFIDLVSSVIFLCSRTHLFRLGSK